MEPVHEPPDSMLAEPLDWRVSTAVGKPDAGRLVNGVQLPSEGEHFFTWDPIRNTTPNRPGRRYATDRLVRVLLDVLADFRAAHPGAARVGIGDLSRPAGGDFGAQFGAPGHASHQNGLDADVYYPRRDGRERGPASVAQVDRALAQDLADRFVRAGARFVFVGLRVRLRGPRRIVQPIPLHENHLHVRIR
jgi:murein endopeptidase